MQVTVLNALGLISPHIVSEIEAGIEDGLANFRRHAHVEAVGISVHDSGFVMEETGFGGISYGPQSFALYVDPGCESVWQDTRGHAAAVVVHELHHCLRQRSCPLRPYKQMCAGDVLVLEGLAMHCEEFLGYGAPPAIRGVSFDRVQPLIRQIAPDIDDPSANWGWIYERNGLTHGALYPMGRQIVAPLLSAQRSNPIAMADVPWREFWTAFQAADLEKRDDCPPSSRAGRTG